MSSSGAAGEWVRRALEHPRYEVLPTPSVEREVLATVPREVRITVTASPSRGIGATLDVAERLAGEGYRVVPHLAARMIAGRAQLAEIVERLGAAGIGDVFCPAGDADPPAGDYAGALPMLQDLTDMGRPFAAVGITGYPESHPEIEDEVTVQSMEDKRHHATYIVSNLCFDPRTVATWVRRIRRRGVELPVVVGMPGPVERARLLRVARKIGVGESIRFVGSHVGAVARMAAPGGYRPERFLLRAGEELADPALGVDGVHVFTFNQLRPTESWRRSMLRSIGSD